MKELLTAGFISGFLGSLLRVGTPILIVATGEMVAERSGVLNLGVEGIMLAGSFTGFYLGFISGNPWLGVFGALIIGALLGLVVAVLSVKWKANQIVTGIGLWIFCMGMVGFANRKAFGIISVPPSIPGLSPDPIPLLCRIPVIGEIFFSQNILFYLSWLLVVVIFYMLKYTSWGLNLKSVGENPAVAEAAGINYARVRYISVAFGGALAGLGGSILSLYVFHFFTNEITTGLGFIAVAVVFFGRWRPFGVLLGSFVFATASALQYRLQAMEFPLPYQIILMVPYVTTLLILILFVRGQTGGPASLGMAYKKGK